MDVYYSKRNGLNDELKPRLAAPKSADESVPGANVTKEHVIPAAGKTSTALHRELNKNIPQYQQPGDCLAAHIPSNQRNIPTEVSDQQIDLKQNIQGGDTQVVIPPPCQQVQNHEAGMNSSPQQAQQNIPLSTQLPVISVPLGEVNPSAYVNGQPNISQQIQQVPENSSIAGIPQNTSLHQECHRCATCMAPHATQNYVANVPLSSPVQLQQPQSPEMVQNPQVVNTIVTQPQQPIHNQGNLQPNPQVPCNQGNLYLNPQVPCNQVGQEIAHQNLQAEQEQYYCPSRVNGLEQIGQTNVAEIRHPQAHYNASNSIPAAGVPTKYGHSYFYH